MPEHLKQQIVELGQQIYFFLVRVLYSSILASLTQSQFDTLYYMLRTPFFLDYALASLDNERLVSFHDRLDLATLG